MKIIISPAKKMKVSELDIPHQGYPLFVESGVEEKSTFLGDGTASTIFKIAFFLGVKGALGL